LNERAVGHLYDALHAFESRHRNEPYPVHKKLRFAEPGTVDIYDWIIARLDLPNGGEVLDAGCGVGFGSLRFAQRSTCRVTGISLSANELVGAEAAAARLGLRDRVRFLNLSFDRLPPGAFDLVVAVESLKHSADLGRSLRSIRQSLKPAGQLVVVEDFYSGEEREAAARELARDWSLERLHGETDYLAILGAAQCSVVDLSDRVPRTPLTAAKAKLALLKLWSLLAPREHTRALRAFCGGLQLEKLYSSGQMTYKAIFFRNHGPASP
jgi:SAM-dependent methyltransferase